MDAMPLSVRSWECPACQVHHDRDINTALNIKHQGIVKLKAEGLSISAHRGLRSAAA
ncbi:zinc ribbon domain-containing protein [Halomonas mongoliensis]|uniref:zinc ribbon domain-containing protein n=1 Tax=Halomonas mongoliensis TaxID=321265 RepID=UPI00403AAAF9